MKFQIDQTAPLLPTGCSLIAKKGGVRIGYAHISVTQTVATLADIQVSRFKTRPFVLLPFLRRTHNYRGKGVGSALLRRAIAICKEAGITEIVGCIRGDEERLRVWYKRFGFQVNGSDIRLNPKD
jgi:GNAT superfamily N-acetyltransferase